MNAFLAYASTSVPRSVQRKEERASARTQVKAFDGIKTDLQKKLEERSDLMAMYRRARRAWKEEFFATPYGTRVKALTDWLDQLAVEDAAEGLDQILAEDWLRTGTSDQRYAALSVIGDWIEKVNRKLGGDFLDMPLTDEPTCAYGRVRRHIQGV